MIEPAPKPLRAILYVLTHRSGDVETFQINAIQQNESDAVNLERFRPDNLAGKAKEQLDGLIEAGYSLSNWHVITAMNPTDQKPSPAPSAGALRAVNWILNSAIPEASEWPLRDWEVRRERIAKLIDREIGLPQLLEALNRVHGYMSGVMEYDHGVMGGTLAGKTPHQVMSEAIALAERR